jgi:hypothetical protein
VGRTCPHERGRHKRRREHLVIGPRLLVTLDSRAGWRPSWSARLAHRAIEALQARRDWPRSQDQLPPDPFADTVSMPHAGRSAPGQRSAHAGAATEPLPTAPGGLSRPTGFPRPVDGGAVREDATRWDHAWTGDRAFTGDRAESSIMPTEEARARSWAADPETAAATRATVPRPIAASPAQAAGGGEPLRAREGGGTAHLPSTGRPNRAPSTNEPFWTALEPGSDAVQLVGMEIRPAGGAAPSRPDVGMRPRSPAGSEHPAEPAAERIRPRPPTGPAVRTKGPVAPTSPPSPRGLTKPSARTGHPTKAAPATPTSPLTAEPSAVGPSPTTAPPAAPTSAADPKLVEAVAHELRLAAARERERRGEWP